jgi:hypothetical protein
VKSRRKRCLSPFPHSAAPSVASLWGVIGL